LPIIFAGALLHLRRGAKQWTSVRRRKPVTLAPRNLPQSRQRDFAHLSAGQLEQLFALSFAFEQLQRNTNDLERCMREWANSPGKPTA
jgi:hypothetical protein